MATFEELLDSVDFQYNIFKNEADELLFQLIDKQNTYLGGKNSYETEINVDNISGIVEWAVERLSAYWHDALVKPLISETKNETVRKKLQNHSNYYPDMLEYISAHNIASDTNAYYIELLDAICNPEKIDITELTEKIWDENEYIIPMTYRMYSTVVVRGAKNLEEAIKTAQKNAYALPLPSPENAEYIDDSYTLDVEPYENIELAQSDNIKGVLLDVTKGKPQITRL